MFRSLTSWSTAWSHCWQMWETPSLQRTVCLTLTLPAGNWLFHTLFFYSGKDFMFFLLPRVKDHLIQRNFLSLSTPPPQFPDTFPWSQDFCTGVFTWTCMSFASRTTWRSFATCSTSWSCCSRLFFTVTTRGRFRTVSCLSWGSCR